MVAGRDVVHEFAKLFSQHAMNKRNGDRAFTYCRCDALDIAAPHVAHGEHPGEGSLEQIW